jgi:uncharacterized membrane protein
MEAKIKHLEFIQATINRMASNSFLLKGWTVTLIGGLIAVALKQVDPHYLYISMLILVMFWLLDAYYLSRERKFVALYDHVRTSKSDTTDFSMETQNFKKRCSLLRCAVSNTLLLFYGGLLVIQLIIHHFI